MREVSWTPSPPPKKRRFAPVIESDASEDEDDFRLRRAKGKGREPLFDMDDGDESEGAGLCQGNGLPPARPSRAPTKRKRVEERPTGGVDLLDLAAKGGGGQICFLFEKVTTG